MDPERQRAAEARAAAFRNRGTIADEIGVSAGDIKLQKELAAQ